MVVRGSGISERSGSPRPRPSKVRKDGASTRRGLTNSPPELFIPSRREAAFLPSRETRLAGGAPPPPRVGAPPRLEGMGKGEDQVCLLHRLVEEVAHPYRQFRLPEILPGGVRVRQGEGGARR